jgi:hypothetical protein
MAASFAFMSFRDPTTQWPGARPGRQRPTDSVGPATDPNHVRKRLGLSRIEVALRLLGVSAATNIRGADRAFSGGHLCASIQLWDGIATAQRDA